MGRLAQTEGLTEFERDILATVRDFTAREIIPVATELEHRDEYPAQIVEGMRKLGLFGLTIPEDYDGLGASLLLGMSVPDVSGQAIANLEVESLKHVAPTFHGDTIYGETTVLGKRLTSRGDRGVVEVETRGYKQDGTLVCVFRRKVMVPTETYIKERGGEQPGRPEPAS